MARRSVESLTGVGTVHAGDVLLRQTRYELTFWSDEASPAAGADPASTVSIEGRIDITGIAEAVVLAGPDTLTLTIEDGRRMAFQLTSSGGGIVARGWLPSV
jgi:hypothetical protein